MIFGWFRRAATSPSFVRLNDGWNAEPNDPDPLVLVNQDTVSLEFVLNPFLYEAGDEERGRLVFDKCARWRLGATNDEGFYKGQCRYSDIAPGWGEFYELTGPDACHPVPSDWVEAGGAGDRHFLFYQRDATFECFASDWRLERPNHPRLARSAQNS